MHYTKLGENGKELLILHGWMQSSINLLPLAKLLSKNFQVYLVDLPGFGKSPMINKNPKTSDYVEAVKKFINEKKIKPNLLGHSFGGKISVKFSSLYPEMLDNKLILIGTPGLPQKVAIWKVIRKYFIKYFGKVLRIIDAIVRTKLFDNLIVKNFGSRDYKNAGSLRGLLVQTINEDLTKFASIIQKDTLIICGKKDHECPPSQAVKYNELIINSKLKLLPYHNHFPFEDVGSHLMTKIISEFMDDKQ